MLPWQALDAVKTFIHPKLIFHYRNYHTSAAFIRANSITVSEGERHGLDYIYRQAIRRLLGHSNSASIDHLYSPIDLGGVGCVSAWDEYKIQSMVQIIRMLTAKDYLIIDAAVQSIHNLRRSESDSFGLTLDLLLADALKVPQNSWWNKVSLAIRFFIKEQGLVFSATVEHRNNSSPLIYFHITDEENLTTSFSSNNTHKLSPFLHKLVALSHFKKWSSKPKAGLLASNLSVNKDFNRRFIKGKLGSTKLWIFLNKARVGDLPTNANRFNNNSLCRQCHQADEWNPHALCGCPKMLPHINLRHNRILDILIKFLRANLLPSNNWEIMKEELPPYFRCSLRPDIQIFNESCKVYVIIDVKCPYDSDLSMISQDARNLDKYQIIVDSAQSALPHWDIRNFTFIIGCLGSWYLRNNDIFQTIRIRLSDVRNLAFNAASSAVKSSSDIWDIFQRATGHLTFIVRFFPCCGAVALLFSIAFPLFSFSL